MKCPHCLKEIHAESGDTLLGTDKETNWAIRRIECPACERYILFLLSNFSWAGHAACNPKKVEQVRPRGSARPPVPSAVIEESPGIAEDYNEACLVLPDSSKASAALSRRCLQTILRAKAGVKPGNLSSEIDQVLAQKTLPSQLAESIDAIRNTGNFAAHPIKSENTGEILQVEPVEAEWNLEVIEMLFDFYYVQPASIAARRAALNERLAEAGKPLMK